MGIHDHVISLHYVCVSVWIFNKIINLASYAQGHIAMMVKAEGPLEKQTRTAKGKMAQGSAFPVK